MPDRWGRPTFEDGMGLVGLAHGFMQIQDFQDRQQDRALGLKKRKEFEAAAGMSEGTALGLRAKAGIADIDYKAKERSIKAEVATAFLEGELVDGTGEFTEQGLALLQNPPNKKKVVGDLKTKGTDAYLYFKTLSDFTGELVTKGENEHNLRVIAKTKAKEDYKNVSTLVDSARIEFGRGNTEQAATFLAKAVNDSGVRKKAEVTPKFGIRVWEVVDGIRQPSETISVGAAFDLAEEMFMDDKYVNERAADIIVGRQMNEKGRDFILQTPDGKTARAMQKFRSDGSTDTLFFNMSGDIMEDAPENLEEAYYSGWKKHDPKARLQQQKTKADIAYKEKQTESLGKVTPKEQRAGEARLKAADTKYLRTLQKELRKEKKELAKLKAEFYHIPDEETGETGPIYAQAESNVKALEDKIRDLTGAKKAGAEKSMAEMPPAEQHEGKVIRDTKTNKRYKSDGTQWTGID